MAVWKALKPKDTNNDKVFLVMGPWFHGQEIQDGSTLGAINFHSDTALEFRQNVLRPFLDHYLKDDAPASNVATVTAYETGTNKWQKLTAFPGTVKPTPLYLAADGKAGFMAPQAGGAAYDEYISDPAKPVPFRARPIQPVGYDPGMTWSKSSSSVTERSRWSASASTRCRDSV